MWSHYTDDWIKRLSLYRLKNSIWMHGYSDFVFAELCLKLDLFFLQIPVFGESGGFQDPPSPSLLGRLYDVRQEKVLPEVRLWAEKTMSAFKTEQSLVSSNTLIPCANIIYRKSIIVAICPFWKCLPEIKCFGHCCMLKKIF